MTGKQTTHSISMPTASLKKNDADDDGDATTGEINAIYLDPSEWDRGVGRELWLRSFQALTEASFQTSQ